jgi:hypothetical protein
MPDFDPITKYARDNRVKRVSPVVIGSVGVTTLVSAAISGTIRHVVDVRVQPYSGARGCQVAIQDASGASSCIARANWGSKLQPGTSRRDNRPWRPDAGLDGEDEVCQLIAGESLVVTADEETAAASGCGIASASIWDE